MLCYFFKAILGTFVNFILENVGKKERMDDEKSECIYLFIDLFISLFRLTIHTNS